MVDDRQEGEPIQEPRRRGGKREKREGSQPAKPSQKPGTPNPDPPPGGGSSNGSGDGDGSGD